MIQNIMWIGMALFSMGCDSAIGDEITNAAKMFQVYRQSFHDPFLTAVFVWDRAEKLVPTPIQGEVLLTQEQCKDFYKKVEEKYPFSPFDVQVINGSRFSFSCGDG